MLPYAILGLLAHEPHHGYDLKNALEKALGGNREINFGQVYTTLARLERNGLVSAAAQAEDGRGKKTYQITERGRAELADWLDRPVEKRRPLQDEFFARLLVRQLAGSGSPQESIARQRQVYLEQLRELTALAATGEHDDFMALLIEGAMLHLQADLRWLDLCDERLEV
jgi:DNA-binding PadR family transcriptional regulator